MKKHILKSLVLLASISLAACNVPGGKTSNTSNGTSEQESVVSSTTSGTTSADPPLISLICMVVQSLR